MGLIEGQKGGTRARAGDLTHDLTKLVLLNPDLMSDLGDEKSA
jgi:hypothetical protein